MADIGTLNPEQMLQQQQILRQQKMAEMLMQQPAPQGQMIGNRFVAPSFTQNLANLANIAVGQYKLENADQKQIDLAKAIRNQEGVALGDYMSELQGKPAVPEKVTELAGPYMGNIPKPTATIAGQPAVEGNPMLANMNALQNPNSPAFLRQHAIKKITEGPNWAEVSQVNPRTGDTDTYVYDKNSADPKSTMRFVATSKPALSVNDRLTLTDRGIAIPNNLVGGSNIAGGNMPVAGNPAGGGQINPQATIVKPVSATNVPQTDLVKAFGYDPFKPPPLPAGLPSPQDARAYRSDQFKPLEGEKAKKVNGAASYQDALDKYVQVINSVDLKDLANPQVRNRIDSAYNTAMLTGKNAFDLGVLNGGDERILNSLLPNYKDVSQLLVTKQTIKELAQAQKEYGTGVILKEYGSANKPVPEMYRKHIVVPKSVTPDVPAKKGGIPAGIDPAIWAVMTPQEKSLWQ
jgi:hypothetical protein